MSGYVDLQVNGYAGVDFNSAKLTESEMVAACQRLQADGVDKILATIITAPMPQMIDSIQRIARWIDEVAEIREVVAGLHIEGPFINPADGFVGAHPIDAVISANIDDAARLIDAGGSHVRILTLAPECDPGGIVIRYLSDQGITVSAGHSNLSLDELDRSIDSGLAMFTHLGNGCPATQPRHDNVIQRVLSRADRIAISFIADGHHVPIFALKNYLRCIPTDNIIIVSDAISAAGLGPGKYPLAGQTVYVDAAGAAWAECRTHYAGCATPLRRMHEILATELSATDSLIDAWMMDNPRRLGITPAI